jgi:hypothetical protein
VASAPSLPANNRYRRIEPDAIVYSVTRIDNGWKIEAAFPKHVSAGDRQKVINWFREYQSQIRRLHPLWVTSFRSLARGYAMEVKPVKDPRELMEKGQNLKGIWTDEIANRA